MSPRLHDRLFLHQAPSIDILKSTCQRYERMWARQSDHGREGRFSGRLAELGYSVPNEMSDGSNRFEHVSLAANWDAAGEPYAYDSEVTAMYRNPAIRPNAELLILYVETAMILATLI